MWLKGTIVSQTNLDISKINLNKNGIMKGRHIILKTSLQVECRILAGPQECQKLRLILEMIRKR